MQVDGFVNASRAVSDEIDVVLYKILLHLYLIISILIIFTLPKISTRSLIPKNQCPISGSYQKFVHF